MSGESEAAGSAQGCWSRFARAREVSGGSSLVVEQFGRGCGAHSLRFSALGKQPFRELAPAATISAAFASGRYEHG